MAPAGRPVPERHDRSELPVLPTSVVGSYSVPEWLERLKNDFYQRRLSYQHLSEICEVAIKAALKDQELTGIDVVSDGELRRDNDIDYLLARIPGIEILNPAKTYYYDYYETVIRAPLPSPEGIALGLAEDFAFTQTQTDRPVKFSFTGPFSLSRRIRNEAYASSGDLVRALAEVLNAEAHRLTGAGATLLQMDEPFLAGYPEQVPLAVKAFNAVFDGIDHEKTVCAVHVCYGNRNARPLWEGHYDFLFPRILDANIDQLVLEFARKGYDDLELIKKHVAKNGLSLGLGVINVKSHDVETPEEIAARIRRALRVLPPERIMVNPDCGLRNLPSDIALAKLRALGEGTEIVRREVLGK